MSESSPTPIAEAPTESQLVPAGEDATDAPQEDTPGQYELTLLIPSQSFISLAHLSPQPREANSEGLLELPIPVAPSDAVQELRNLITESPEGFWLGAFGFVPVEAAELPSEGDEKVYGPWVEMQAPTPDPTTTVVDPNMWKLTPDGVLGDFCEMAPVFGTAEVEGKKRGLKVVLTSYSPLATSLHLLRFRDTLFGSLPNQNANASYDPTSLAINSGSTLYTTVRGGSPAGEAAAEEASEDAKSKKSKAAKKDAAAVPAPTEPVPESSTAEPTHPFSNWTLDSLTPFSYLDQLRAAASPALASPCIKTLGISAWSPPPHARRMRGDIVYLSLTTLEGESYQLTASATGFWVCKSTPTTFDPTARTPTPRGLRPTPYHSLFELVCGLSPLFAKALVRLVQTQNPAAEVATDVYATLAISHATPASSWVVPAPTHVADPFRTQLAYLLTTSTTADLLPPARDWNDEFCQYRDLPQATMQERLLRERLVHRVQCDFVAAATRGAIAIARGDVPPLNPNEATEAHTFIHNNMLFTRADDAIGSYAHVGGNDAARVAAAKDLQGVQTLEQLDVKGLSTMASVLVDFLGERWVVQSLIPGLFKATEEDKIAEAAASTVYPEGDESAIEASKTAAEQDKPFPNMETANRDDYPSTGAFRIVYGSGNPEEPDEKVRKSAYFATLAKAVADKINFAEHSVIASDGQVTKLWTSTDMHGIAAPDGRSYFIDCFRLHCTDVEFLENNLSGATFTDAAVAQANGEHTPPQYPHRLTLLRPELLELYRDSKLEAWIDARVTEHRARLEAEEKAAASVESELKEAATDPSAPKEPKAPAVIQASDFVLSFNPDAFVERKPKNEGEAANLIYDPEEESTKNVRDAAKYLRETILPGFVVMMVSSVAAITDGHFLAKIMHRRGINIRYLGLLADIAERQGPTLEYPKGTSKPDIEFGLACLKDTLQHAMVTRACKHILNRLLRSSLTCDHASLIAHFFNCLVGTSFEPNPTAELVELPRGSPASREWASLSPASLPQEIITEVESRYRYTIPSTFFDPEALIPTRLVREICMRVGIQLVLREYKFGPRTSSHANGAAASADEDKLELAHQSSEAPGGIKKKKKKSPAQVEREAAKHDEHRTVSFRPEDVLNTMPVIKATIHKSQLADETFAAGTVALDKGNYELGQEIIQDALNFYEQIFGAIHPEAASHFHTLGIMYHNIAQGALRKVQTHETAEDQLKNMVPEARIEGAKRFQEYLLENPDVQRAEAEHFLQAAVRMLRQSVIIAERAFGLDSPEAIQHYSDLGLLEQSIGNTDAGMRLTKHAMSLWVSTHGPHHPSNLNLLSNVATMIQTRYGALASMPLLTECWTLAKSIYGDKSMQAASLEYQMAQVYGLTGRFAESIQHGTSALLLFQQLCEPDASELIEAGKFLVVVTEAAGREGREQEERAERLRKKFPKLMADKDIRARIGAASASASSSLSQRSAAPAPAPPVEAAPVVPKKDNSPKANLSVDELVGSAPQPTTSSKPAVNRGVQTHPKAPTKTLFERFKATVTKLGPTKSKAPLGPDGLTNAEAKAPSDPAPTLSFADTVLQQAKAGHLLRDVRTGAHAAEQLLGGPIDDRKLLLEEIVTMLGSLPPDSSIGNTVQDALVTLLWNDLPHPPTTFIGAKFRAADGSGNNPSNPSLGKAGTPYARSVPPVHPLPHNLPDPGLVFDALLKRDSFEPHPSGISAFQTSRTDPTINDTSSYLDLSPLYGNNQEEQNTVRTGKQGELWPDTWASSRLGLMPPHVVALLILFARNHNFIAHKLFSINERGMFKPLSALDADAIAAQDEELFQTARLINCGFFANVVFYGVIRSLGSSAVPRGVGNACSIEFQILYRWHSTISAEDEMWTVNLFKKILPDVPFDEMTEADFVVGLRKLGEAQGVDPRRWTFGDLKRQGEDGCGHFRDSDLCNLLTNATDAIAGSFRGRGTPACMRIIDVLGIAMARNDWNTCSMNEFRKFLNLKPFDDFKDWNSDPEIWKTAEKLYSHIDNLELFPGLLAESSKPSQEGSGLAPGYTISRAILSDAAALVRGDRFLTTDLNAASLTNWGFEDIQPVLNGGSFGGVLGKIIMRTLPSSYSFNSTYALFPFSTPATTKAILNKMELSHKYNFSKPKAAAPWHPAFTFKACRDILADHKTFGVVYGPGIQEIVGTPYGYFIGFDDVVKHARDRQIMDQALFPAGFEIPMKEFYRSTTRRLIQEKGWSIRGKTVHLDVVRDVITITPVLWAAEQFGVPLRTQTSKGLLTPQEFYRVLSAFFAFVFMNFSPQPGFALREAATAPAKLVVEIIEARLGSTSAVNHMLLGTNGSATQASLDFYARLLESKRPREQLTASAFLKQWSRLTSSSSTSPLTSESTMIRSSFSRTIQAADDKIWALVLEVMRLDPQSPGIPRVALRSGSFQDGDKEVNFNKGDMLFASIWSSGRDPSIFANPDAVDISRDPSLYQVFGDGMHNCLGSKLVRVAIVEVVREIFKLKNVRRAPGPGGNLYRSYETLAGTPIPTYMTPAATPSPFPTSLNVLYDI
ncbi:hypothetical protein RQP46_006770 [Phenoliferia psychrophenolica]